MKRILFVDDEAKILDGLKRMLRGQRREWEMTFVDGGPAALEALAATPFDVIVSDMRMPGMDGATLLSRVQEEFPGTVRIVLSGHTELEAAMRAVPVAHQFLSKPCESALLRDVVERACGLQALLADESLLETVGNVDTLPSIPRVYHALVAALADPDVSLDDVVAIVQQDSAIVAKILQLVNSSFFGVARTISDLKHATTYLGTSMLRNLTLSIEVFRAFEVGGLPPGFSLEREQAHATLGARIARRLLEDKAQAENAFLAAMLHDVGKLILATKLRDAHERVAAVAATREDPLHVIETEVHGVSHAEVGAYLLGIWGMPYPIVEAVANHHAPSRVEHEGFDVLGAVHVADALAHEVSDAAVGSPASSPGRLDLDYLEQVGVAGELPGWRELAAEEAAATQQAA